MANHQPTSSYVLCIDDGGYPASLEVRKVYVTLPDQRAAERDYIRVIDETGEDYLYPAKLFVAVVIPPEAASLFVSATAIQPTPTEASLGHRQGRNRE
jgi:hypothetical protein